MKHFVNKTMDRIAYTMYSAIGDVACRKMSKHNGKPAHRSKYVRWNRIRRFCACKISEINI